MQQPKQHPTDLINQLKTKQLLKKYPFTSMFLPPMSRKPVYNIHAFIQMANNIVNDTNISKNNRLILLDEMANKLDKLRYGKSINTAIFSSLADSIERFDLPVSLFHNLLKANKMQLTVLRFEDFGELMEYYRLSATPIGQLLLRIVGAVSLKNIAYLDAISIAIQLCNNLQNIKPELTIYNRLYLPMDEMEQYQITEQMLISDPINPQVQQFMTSQIARAHQLLQSGAYIGKQLKGLTGLESRLIIAGTSRILQKMHKNSSQNAYSAQLTFNDGIKMLYKALLRK